MKNIEVREVSNGYLITLSLPCNVVEIIESSVEGVIKQINSFLLGEN